MKENLNRLYKGKTHYLTQSATPTKSFVPFVFSSIS